VEVDSRRIRGYVTITCLTALLILVPLLYLAGVHRNAQVSGLRQHGVAVDVVVSRCVGLLGGSGSNGAGYQCEGTYTVHGHRYAETIPGNTLYPPKARVPAIVDPGDPTLLSSPAAVERSRPSESVFILPTVLAVGLILMVTCLVLRRRRLR
jgi:hypothetical protein